MKLFRFIVLFYGGLFGIFNYQKALDGITYVHQQTRSPLAQSMHVLTIDPSKAEIRLVKAGDQCVASDKVSTMAEQEKAIAAINGGYCYGTGALYGVPTSVFKIFDTWFADSGLPEPIRAVLAWDAKNNTLSIERIAVRMYLMLGDKKIPVTRINQERSDTGIFVYTPCFSYSTLTGADGVECIVQNGKITDVIVGRANAKIPSDGFVISIGSKGPAECLLFQKGASVELVSEIIAENQKIVNECQKKDFILAGAPVLVWDGVVIKNFDSERLGKNFFQERHARTAVGVLPNGNWLVVVIDGYEKGVAEGMTIEELALFMQQQGCVKAINLSGGASAVMWLNGAIKSFPGKECFGFKIFFEKEVSDAIVIKPCIKSIKNV